MKTKNALIMKQARESLSGRWGLAIGGCLVYILVISVANSIDSIGPIIALIITGPMSLGLTIFSLSFSRKKETKITQIFDGFNNFIVSLYTYLLVILYTFLWSLLLVIPGIIASISYSQVFYILAEDSSISASDAIKKSKKMMYGYKWKYVCLGLRFFWWFLLTILTLGIGFIWLFPYIQISMAKFYEDVSGGEVVQVQV